MIKLHENLTAKADSNKGKKLFFSGSNSTNSINQLLIETLLKHTGQDTDTLINLRNFPMPLYSDTEEEKGIPKKANTLLEIIDKHDILVIAVPEHNSGMPAFFKNTIDWMSRARSSYKILSGKKVILLCASPGNGGKNTILNTQTVLTALGAEIIGFAIISDFHNQIIRNGESIHIKDSCFISKFNNMLTQVKRQ